MKLRLLRIISVTVLVSLLAALVLLNTQCSPASTSSPKPATGDKLVTGTNIGNLAPDFELQSLDGETVSLSGLRGKPVLINFWASWCGPCREEMPFLQEILEAKKWSSKGLVILTVNIAEPLITVEKFMEVNQLSLPVLLDRDRNVAQKYNIRVIPTTFFVDKSGIIRDRVIGAFPNKSAIEKRLINSIIEE